MKNRLVILLAPLLTMLPGIAGAHAMLERATPPVGSTVHASPALLTLLFSEAVEPHFSKVAISGPGHVAVATGALRTDPTDAKTLLVPLARLPPGAYTVAWHAVSVDTHRTQGTYRFTIAP